MHDTLANRGRINYSSYNQEEQVQIQKITTEFLDGQRDNIGEMDSLRKVREVFSQIRLVYRKMQQNNDAIRRQIDSNPEAFKTLQNQTKGTEDQTKRPVISSQTEERKSISQEAQQEANKKRPAIDKQEAFIEFKSTDQGTLTEENIHNLRQVTKERRTEIKGITEDLNKTKSQIDRLKQRLDRKENERRMRL